MHDVFVQCYQTSLPASGYTGGATAAPLRGAVGYTLAGVNIYGPMDAGFTAGQVRCALCVCVCMCVFVCMNMRLLAWLASEIQLEHGCVVAVVVAVVVFRWCRCARTGWARARRART